MNTEPELLDRAPRLFDRVAHFVRRDHPGSEQALGICRAVVVEPVVVGARDGGGERRVQVVHGLGEEAARGIDHSDVDAFRVHRRELRPTVIARKTSFGSQSYAGAKTRETLMSLVRTLTLRFPDPERALQRAARRFRSPGWRLDS